MEPIPCAIRFVLARGMVSLYDWPEDNDAVVPRIGETVRINARLYLVKSITHEMLGFGDKTHQDIMILVDEKG